ncbi:MAG: hypothetical protein B6I26_00155 [Desulfobacteraceae bacterium 4572_130]|nr:MAG: hypothetical protein B6I26_00155 [Desulfobacteraceae bacterium 4572_130]
MTRTDFFHGVVLANIVNKNDVSLKKYKKNNSSYIINDTIGIYNKYSQKRISPWSFSFLEKHINQILEMNKNLETLFIILICNNDGICCLNYQEFGTVLSVENKMFPKWIKASRLKKEKYSVSGSDGKLSYKIGNNKFPEKIFN